MNSGRTETAPYECPHGFGRECRNPLCRTMYGSDGHTPASPYSVARLRELHAAPKNNVTAIYRFATPAQMDELYAMHDAFPAIAELVQAAWDFFQGSALTIDDPRLRYVEIQCDKAEYERLGRALGAFDVE